MKQVRPFVPRLWKNGLSASKEAVVVIVRWTLAPLLKASRFRLVSSAAQIDTRLLPVPLDGALGGAAHGGDLGEGKAAEEFQIDDFSEGRIRAGERIQRVTDLGQLGRVGEVFDDVGAQRGDLELAAAFDRAPIARKNVAAELSNHAPGKKMS